MIRNTLGLSDEEYDSYIDAMADMWKEEVRSGFSRFPEHGDDVTEESH